QAVPLIAPEAPLVGTGMEVQTASDSGHVILAPYEGVIESVDASRIVVRELVEDGEAEPRRFSAKLRKYMRSNQGTCVNQRPIVTKGQRVRAGQPLADSSSTSRGELALGQNVLCAFMSWEGGNFED